MKNNITTLLLLLPFFATCQLKITNPGLTDPTAPVFYIGWDNHIIVSGMDHPEKYIISISGAGGLLSVEGVGKYVIRTARKDSCTIRIQKMNKVVLERKYASLMIPDPVATLGGYRDTTMSIAGILSNPGLRVVFRNCLAIIPFTVFSFDASFATGGDNIITFSGSVQLTNEQITLVRKLTPGDHIYFDNILAAAADGITRKLSPFRITIK